MANRDEVSRAFRELLNYTRGPVRTCGLCDVDFGMHDDLCPVKTVGDFVEEALRTRSEGAEPEADDFGPTCEHCDEIVEDCSCGKLFDALDYVAENLDTLRSRLRSAAGPSKEVARAIRGIRPYVQHREECVAISSMGPCTCGAEIADRALAGELQPTPAERESGTEEADPWTIDCDPRRDVAPDENIQIVDAEGVTVCFMSNCPNRNHIRDAERIVGRSHPMYAGEGSE